MARSWYYVDRNDNEIGPVDSHEIRQRVADETISPTTQIWRDDLPDWVEASRIKKLWADHADRLSRQPKPLARRSIAGDEATLENAWEDDWATLADQREAVATASGEQLRSFARPVQTSAAVIEHDDVDDDAVWQTGGTASDMGGGEYASPLARLAARFIDGCFVAVGFVVLLGLMFVGIASTPDEDARAVIGILGVLSAVVYSVISGFVVIPMQNAGEQQASWGKRIVGIIVTDTTGERASFSACLGRELAQGLFGFVPFLSFVNILWPFFDDSQQCLHDKMANTLVLKRG